MDLVLLLWEHLLNISLEALMNLFCSSEDGSAKDLLSETGVLDEVYLTTLRAE